MKKYSFITFILFHFFQFSSQTDNINGNWNDRFVMMQNTGEADYMIRLGDIDNLGFGWAEKFNPFSGESTDSHAYPWDRDTTELLGFDMILLPSSMTKKGQPPCGGGDGYSATHAEMMKRYGKTTFPFQISLKDIDTSIIKNITLQLFVDDFQSKIVCSKFEVYINNARAPFMEKILNELQQTGPIGELITVVVPKEYINNFKNSSVVLLIDDTTTGAGDGFAIDFIKILINPKLLKSGTITGKVISEITGKPIANANVICGGQVVKTNTLGYYKLTKVAAGSALISVDVKGKTEQNFTAAVKDNAEIVMDLFLK